MLRSLYAGISGMKNFQTKLDVIGNNIANVNTPGFKKGRVTFQDMLSQTTSPAQAPQGDDLRGGVNPAQVGVGSQLGSVDNIHTQGFRQTTNNPLDLMLEGDGMFALEGNGTRYYTRSGNFYLDDGGNIVNQDGHYLVGEDGTYPLTIPDTAQSFSIATDGTITYIDENDVQQELGSRIAVANFSNPSGLEKAGSNLFLETPNAGFNGLVAPEDDGSASIVSGALEMSNVDLAEEFTEMITAQRAFQANTRTITTSDQILEEIVNLKR